MGRKRFFLFDPLAAALGDVAQDEKLRSWTHPSHELSISVEIGFPFINSRRRRGAAFCRLPSNVKHLPHMVSRLPFSFYLLSRTDHPVRINLDKRGEVSQGICCHFVTFLETFCLKCAEF